MTSTIVPYSCSGDEAKVGSRRRLEELKFWGMIGLRTTPLPFVLVWCSRQGFVTDVRRFCAGREAEDVVDVDDPLVVVRLLLL